MRKSCECGTCGQCRNRVQAARYRAQRKREGVGRVDSTGPTLAHLSLEELQAAAAKAIKDDEIRAYGPQAPKSTLDPANVFWLRKSRSK